MDSLSFSRVHDCCLLRSLQRSLRSTGYGPTSRIVRLLVLIVTPTTSQLKMSTPPDMLALQNDLAYAILKTCQHDSSIILRWLRAEGFTELETPVFPNYDDIRGYPEPRDYLPLAKSMALHLKLLWSIVEQRKVSIAVTYNPLMAAVGYICLSRIIP